MTDETRAIVCVTNDMHDFRSCTYKDAHRVNCDGAEYGWNDKHDREETTGRECRGCRPREARNGHLCLGCWDRVVSSVSEWATFEPRIAGVERAVQRDNGGIRGSSLGYVPIPGTLLAVEEIRSYIRSMTGNVDQWISTADGARDAVRFARAVASALRTHAVEEKAHRVKRTRCPHCAQLTLVWNPAQAFGGHVTVKCSNPACQAELAQESFEKIAIIENPGMEGSVLLEAGQALNARGDFAEPYEPARLEHAHLDPLSAVKVGDLRDMAFDLDVPSVGGMRKIELIEAIRAAQYLLIGDTA